MNFRERFKNITYHLRGRAAIAMSELKGEKMFFHYLKMLIIMASFAILSSCTSDSAPDCFQSAGDIVRDEVVSIDFTKITVFENVSLVLKQGPETKVEIETGEFLRNEVTAIVEGDRLLLRDTNDCNFVRAFGLTKVYVTAPNISEIRSSTGLKIESDGLLTYPSLNLISESFINSESETTDGEFDLELDTNSVTIVVNGIAYFKLSGETEFLGVRIAAGDSRVEAQNLTATIVDVNHRGSNDILVNPQQAIKGTINGTGDVISFNTPASNEVEELFKGRLIFKN